MSDPGWTDRPRASRSVVRSRHGMIATAHPLASAAGVSVLREGGSAVDAAIAANAVLAVVEPVSCGLGGDLFALVWDPATSALSGLDASGRCPLGLRLDLVRAGPDGTIPLRSPQSWTVPGAVSGWFALHARHGRLPLRRILADAEAIAREGFPVTEVIANAWRMAARHEALPGFAEVFLPRGRPPAEGEIFRNLALARTLSLLADGGEEAFYRGESAEEIVRFSRQHGGAFELADFAEHRSTWVEPVSTTFAGCRLFELPPATQGVAALEMLSIAEAGGIEEMRRGSAEWWHLLIEAKKLAFEDRARWIGDASSSALVDELISKEHARRRAALIDPARAATGFHPTDPRLDRAETTYLAAADPDGLMVSLIQSNYTGFGSGHAVPSVGIGLQNRGALFSLHPGGPNTLAPGRRPFHTIIPAFALRGEAPWLAFGVMGGDMQPQGHVQVLVNLLCERMNLQEAGDAPRFHHGGSSEPTGLVAQGGGVLHLEPGVAAAVVAELERRGHQLADGPWSFGGYQAVAREGEAWAGATERRKDGCALGW